MRKQHDDIGEVSAPAPVLALLHDKLVTPKYLAERWGLTVGHLASLRNRGVGLPYIKLPHGAKKPGIRYRLSDILAAEVAGMGGGLTVERVRLEVAACEDLTESQKLRVIERLTAALS